METRFIYFNEEAKFRIGSSIFVLAIILLAFLSGLGNNKPVDFADFEHGKVMYYSRILGLDSSDDSPYANGYISYGHKFNISLNGNVVFAANSE